VLRRAFDHTPIHQENHCAKKSTNLFCATAFLLRPRVDKTSEEVSKPDRTNDGQIERTTLLAVIEHRYSGS
jgi:hypothetical protein